MKLTQEPTEQIIFKVTDLSGCYTHIAIVSLLELTYILQAANGLIEHIRALIDCEVNFKTNISWLIKEDKEDLLGNWQEMTNEKGYCFLEATKEELTNVTDCSSDIYREKMKVTPGKYFELTYNTVLDEDGAIMEYGSDSYSMTEFLKNAF